MIPAEPNPRASRWTTFVARMTAFAEAVEMDGTSHLHARVTWLERRILALEERQTDPVNARVIGEQIAAIPGA